MTLERSGLCPQCGSTRIPDARFCGTCAFDFWKAAASPVAPAITEVAPPVPGLPTSVELPATGSHPDSKPPRSRRRIALVVIGVILALGLVGSAAGQGDDSQSPVAEATATPEATTDATPRPTPEPTFGPAGQLDEAEVVDVVDGDTIKVELEGEVVTVRYIGIDTPETVDPNSPVMWMGPEASAANAQLVDGQTVYLERDVSETDRFGRLLRYVWLDAPSGWVLVNQELVRQGFAVSSAYPPDVKYQDLFDTAESGAMGYDRGLWGPTPTPVPTPAPTPPLVVRPRHRSHRPRHRSHRPRPRWGTATQVIPVSASRLVRRISTAVTSPTGSSRCCRRTRTASMATTTASGARADQLTEWKVPEPVHASMRSR